MTASEFVTAMMMAAGAKAKERKPKRSRLTVVRALLHI
jgi:hypothetical protein